MRSNTCHGLPARGFSYSNTRAVSPCNITLLLVPVLLSMIGCQSAPVATTAPARDFGPNDRSTQMEFWDTLSEQRLTTNDDAFHAILLYIDHKDDCPDYAARVELLQQRHYLPHDFHARADQAVDRGTVAVALVEMLKIPRGVTMSIGGTMPRYADRLLQFRGLYPTGTPNQILSGPQFMGILSKAEDYQRGQSITLPGDLLPDQHAGAPAVAIVERTGEEDDLDPLPFSEPVLLDLTTLPSTTQAVEPIFIVDGIEGEWVEVRLPGVKRYAPARLNMRLGDGAEIRVGPQSAVRLVSPPDQVMTIDHETKVRISVKLIHTERPQPAPLPIGRANLPPAGIETVLNKTDINIVHGRVRLEVEPLAGKAPGAERPSERIEESGVEHDTTIHSPNSTLAVRGTRVALEDQPPYPVEAISLVGRAEFTEGRRRVFFGNKRTVTNRIRSGHASPVETALAESYVDPSISYARTEADYPLLQNLISRGAVTTFDRGSGLTIVHGGTHPQTDAQLAPLLPGNLNFVLRWTGNTNLDIAVVDQGGPHDFIYPAAGLTNSPSGGVIKFDHQGGPHGGIEVVYYPKTFPGGVYSIGINYISGQTTPATLDAYLGKKHVDLTDEFGNGGQPISTFKATIGPDNRTTAATYSPDIVFPTAARKRDQH
jgi:hypothetical protein